jgi:hypothetical protein
MVFFEGKVKNALVSKYLATPCSKFSFSVLAQSVMSFNGGATCSDWLNPFNHF